MPKPSIPSVQFSEVDEGERAKSLEKSITLEVIEVRNWYLSNMS